MTSQLRNKKSGQGAGTGLVSRISVSLPEELLTDLDEMVETRGFQSRSQAIADMAHRFLAEHKSSNNEVMVGVITLYYDNSAKGLQQELAALQCRYIDECISSLHVHLAGNQTMEVVLVQGPSNRLHAIADMMITKRGVISGRVHLMASVIPPLHPFVDE